MSEMQDLQAIVTAAVAHMHDHAEDEVAGGGWKDWQDPEMWQAYVATLKSAAGWVGQVDGQPAAVVTVVGGHWTYSAAEALDWASVELYPTAEGGMIHEIDGGGAYTPPAA